MATVTVFTAERTAEIEAQAIIGGEVVGDDLILERFNGTTFNAGHVRGDPGPADLTEWLDIADPPGTPKPYEHNVLPPQHGWCNAQTEYDGLTYPKLAAIFGTGAACVNGACADGNFRLPDHRGKFLVSLHSGIGAFDTLRETGGSKDAALIQHNHNHGHGFDVHAGGVDHSHGTGDAGAHSHSVSGDFGDRIAFTNSSTHATVTVGAGDATAQEVAYTSLDGVGNHNHGATGGASAYSHDHGYTLNTDATNAGAADGVDDNLPPYRVVNTIMRLA